MKVLGPLFLFGGYVLVYAATAKGGVFATDPWNGIFADAYVDGGNIGSGNVVGTPAGVSSVATSVSTAAGAAGGVASQILGTRGFSRPRINLPQFHINQNANPPGTPAHGGTF